MSVELLFGFGSLAVSLANAFAIVWAAVHAIQKLDEANEKIEQVHVATNSMKDALVKKTEQEALARGRSDLLAEQGQQT